jgi:hypothetical protein
MKLRVLSCGTLMCALALVASQCKSRSVSTASASEIPHLRKQGTATQLAQGQHLDLRNMGIQRFTLYRYR